MKSVSGWDAAGKKSAVCELKNRALAASGSSAAACTRRSSGRGWGTGRTVAGRSRTAGRLCRRIGLAAGTVLTSGLARRAGSLAAVFKICGVPASAFELKARRRQLLLKCSSAALWTNGQWGVREFLQHILAKVALAALVSIDRHASSITQKEGNANKPSIIGASQLASHGPAQHLAGRLMRATAGLASSKTPEASLSAASSHLKRGHFHLFAYPLTPAPRSFLTQSASACATACGCSGTSACPAF